MTAKDYRDIDLHPWRAHWESERKEKETVQLLLMGKVKKN